MSNSKLATVHYWTNNYSSRNGKKISKIIIHHMATVNGTAATCFNAWKTREGSAHYAISSTGQIGQLVDEKYRAWSVGNAAADSVAVTMELANDGGAKTNWHISDKAIEAAIRLCVDICERNGIEKLTYTGTTSGSLVMHCMYSATACPGPYLKSKFAYIAREVTKRLGAEPDKDTDKTPTAKAWTAYKRPFIVRVECKDLYIRKGPGIEKYGRQTINAAGRLTQFVPVGAYTITDVQVADGYSWGKLKSSTASSPRWIALDYTEYVGPVQEPKKDEPKKTPTIPERILDAAAKQSAYMKDSVYKWEPSPTIAKSKRRGTCVTYVACVLQRLGVISPGKFIWHNGDGHGTGKVTGAVNNKMSVTYMKNKPIEDIRDQLEPGDIVMVDDNKSGVKGNGGHIFIITGKWSDDGRPYIWDNNTAQKGNCKPILYNKNRKVLARIRIKSI